MCVLINRIELVLKVISITFLSKDVSSESYIHNIFINIFSKKSRVPGNYIFKIKLGFIFIFFIPHPIYSPIIPTVPKYWKLKKKLKPTNQLIVQRKWLFWRDAPRQRLRAPCGNCRCPMWKLRAPSKARKKQLPKSEREGCRKSLALAN